MLNPNCFHCRVNEWRLDNQKLFDQVPCCRKAERLMLFYIWQWALWLVDTAGPGCPLRSNRLQGFSHFPSTQTWLLLKMASQHDTTWHTRKSVKVSLVLWFNLDRKSQSKMLVKSVFSLYVLSQLSTVAMHSGLSQGRSQMTRSQPHQVSMMNAGCQDRPGSIMTTMDGRPMKTATENIYR